MSNNNTIKCPVAICLATIVTMLFQLILFNFYLTHGQRHKVQPQTPQRHSAEFSDKCQHCASGITDAEADSPTMRLTLMEWALERGNQVQSTAPEADARLLKSEPSDHAQL